jgi:hypothetical protein
MKRQIGVDCKFEEDGLVRVYRINVGGSWLAVEQGRQWVDRRGRHLLILMPGGEVNEICLRSDTMTWQISDLDGQTTHLA